MTIPAILKFDEAHAHPEEYFLAAEKLIEGNPKQTLWQYYTDPTKKFLSGMWKSEPGKWNISYTEEEFCQILEGVSVVADAQGTAVTVAQGDSFVIPRGFTGTWEVIETTRKIYVIYESGE